MKCSHHESPEERLDWEILSAECVMVSVSFCVWPNKAKKAVSRRAKLHVWFFRSSFTILKEN